MIRYLLHKWFNTSPSPNAPFITDKKGEKFWIYWDSINRMHVSYRGRPVGRVNLKFESNGEVTLADIIIFQNKHNLRNRGLGKAMLQEAIRYAREHQAKSIWGWIQDEDEEHITEEYLTEWYRRQGFKVEDNGSIYFDLQNGK
jgi:GNAT superfamily N-acetyltransferase